MNAFKKGQKVMVNNSKQSGSVLVIVLVVALVICFVAAYFIPLGVYADRGKAVTKPTAPAPAISADTSTDQESKPTTPKPDDLPDGYPVDAAPIYDPSTVTFSSAAGTGWLVTAETSDSLAKAGQTIADTYQALGATVSQDPINDEGVGQVVTSYGGYGILVTYSFDSDKSVTNISYNIEAQ